MRATSWQPCRAYRATQRPPARAPNPRNQWEQRTTPPARWEVLPLAHRQAAWEWVLGPARGLGVELLLVQGLGQGQGQVAPRRAPGT